MRSNTRALLCLTLVFLLLLEPIDCKGGRGGGRGGGRDYRGVAEFFLMLYDNPAIIGYIFLAIFGSFCMCVCCCACCVCCDDDDDLLESQPLPETYKRSEPADQLHLEYVGPDDPDLLLGPDGKVDLSVLPYPPSKENIGKTAVFYNPEPMGEEPSDPLLSPTESSAMPMLASGAGWAFNESSPSKFGSEYTTNPKNISPYKPSQPYGYQPTTIGSDFTSSMDSKPTAKTSLPYDPAFSGTDFTASTASHNIPSAFSTSFSPSFPQESSGSQGYQLPYPSSQSTDPMLQPGSAFNIGSSDPFTSPSQSGYQSYATSQASQGPGYMTSAGGWTSKPNEQSPAQPPLEMKDYPDIPPPAYGN